jgi:hypothetical protein
LSAGALANFPSAEGGGGEAAVPAAARALVPWLLLGVGDPLLSVRMQSKRALRAVGPLAVPDAPDGALPTLLASAALDERWQTDVPRFFEDFVRALAAHSPAELPRLLALACPPESALADLAGKAELLAVRAALAGALLACRVEVDRTARWLLILLSHADLDVRRAAADALAHFPVEPRAPHCD